MTWGKFFLVWGLLFAASVGWDMGKGVSRWVRARIKLWWRRRRSGVPEPVAALRDLIGMVDQMDRRPGSGGGVLPTDKARIMYRARKAAGL